MAETAETVRLSIQMAPEVKRKLEEAAKLNGRSTSSEGNIRLRKSFGLKPAATKQKK